VSDDNVVSFPDRTELEQQRRVTERRLAGEWIRRLRRHLQHTKETQR
jgi:hypothetical protein